MSYGAITLGGSGCFAINHLSTVQSAELCLSLFSELSCLQQMHCGAGGGTRLHNHHCLLRIRKCILQVANTNPRKRQSLSQDWNTKVY